MKTRVLKDDYREIEIHPQEEFNNYIKLINEDIKNIFKSNAGNYFYYCPACMHEETQFKFSKNGFVYRECKKCATIFMTPRPSREMLHDFFKNAEGIKYWNSSVIQESVSRKEHVFEPRIRWIKESIELIPGSNKIYLDFYSKYSPFIKKMTEIKDFSKKVSFKPFDTVRDDLTENGYEILESFSGEKFAFVTAFEVFDRFYNPRSLLSDIKDNMETGGLLFISTTSASGLDFQFLQKNSKNLIPPIHMNIFSIEGMMNLLEDFDFEILELSTPGSLDLQILEKQMADVELPKFLLDIIQNRNSQIKESFQEFIQRARLSSHMRILAKKK